MRVVYLVNVDYFFLSHRLPLALEAQKRGYDVYLLAQNTGRFEEIEQFGIKVIDLPIGRGVGNAWQFVVSFMKLCAAYRRLKPTIVHHVTVKPIILGTMAAALFSRKSQVINAVTGLGYSFANKGRSFTKTMTLFLLKSVFFLSNLRLKFIFQNSDDKALYAHYGLATSDNSTIIRGAGVDEVYFDRKQPNPIQPKRICITLLSRMLKDKGVLEFMNAAHLVRQELEGRALFRLVGGLDLENPACISEKELLALLIDNYVVWEGHRNDVKEVYEETDIACLPSYREGMPKSLIEAMAMSCPIVTTIAPGCRECVEDGVNGYLVPVRNADILANRILRLVNDDDLRLKMGRASRARMLDGMSLRSVIDQTFGVYEA